MLSSVKKNHGIHLIYSVGFENTFKNIYHNVCDCVFNMYNMLFKNIFFVSQLTLSLVVLITPGKFFCLSIRTLLSTSVTIHIKEVKNLENKVLSRRCVCFLIPHSFSLFEKFHLNIYINYIYVWASFSISGQLNELP